MEKKENPVLERYLPPIMYGFHPANSNRAYCGTFGAGCGRRMMYGGHFISDSIGE
jgi:hypothetical protein